MSLLNITINKNIMANHNAHLRPNFILLALSLSVLLLWYSSNVYANDTFWYSSKDPLNIDDITPAPIPDSYLENTTCTTKNYLHNLNLSEVVEAALCNNPQTRESYAQARVQAAQVGIAKSAYFPSVNDNISTNLSISLPEQSTANNPDINLSNSIVASYLLYDFGNRDATLENARQLLQAASATESSVVQNVLLSAIQAFYQVQAANAAVDTAKESERASEESYKAADAKYKAGVLTPADKLQAQTVFAQNTLTRITAEGTLKTAYGTLANVMGLNANQPIKILENKTIQPIQNIDLDINSLIEQASNRRPDLIANEAQLKAALASIEANKAASKPTISVSLSNNMQDGRNTSFGSNTALGMTLSIPCNTE